MFKPFRGAQLNRLHPLAKGIAACWLFNEGTGNQAFDLSGNGNNGTLQNGAGWAGDSRGLALSLDGTDDRVSISLPVFSTTQTEFTVMARCRVDSINGGGASNIVTPIASDWNTWSSGAQKGWRLCAFYNQSSGNTDFRFTVANGTSQGEPTFDAMLHADFVTKYQGKDLLVVGVFNPGANSHSIHVYIDGSLQGIASISGWLAQMTPETATPIYVGYGSINSGYWNGSISYMYMWNRALSVPEIRQLHLDPYSIFDFGINPALLYVAAGGGIAFPLFSNKGIHSALSGGQVVR